MSKYIQDDLCQQILNYLDKKTLMNILRSRYGLMELIGLYVLPKLEEHMAQEEKYEFPERGKLYDLGDITVPKNVFPHRMYRNGIRKTPIGEIRLTQITSAEEDTSYIFRARISGGELLIAFGIDQYGFAHLKMYCHFDDGCCFDISQIKEVKN